MKDDYKDWKSVSKALTEFILGERKISESECEEIDKIASGFDKPGVDVIAPFSRKLLIANIFNRNVDFKRAEKMPHVWQRLYELSVNIVALENGQRVSGR